MTLKSSEVKNCSWWIRTILLLPCFYPTCRQINEDSTGNVSEDHLWFSRIQLLHHFLEVGFHDEDDEWISSTPHNRRENILLVQHRSKFFLQWVRFLEKGQQVLILVVLLWPLIGMQNPSHPISTHILRAAWNFLLNVVHIHHKLVWSMRKSYPRVSIIFVHRHNSDLNSELTWQQQVATSNTGLILVFPRIQPSGSDAPSSLGRVYSRQAAASVNCENSAVSFVMEYCPISTTFRNPASIKYSLNLSCCANFSIRSPYCWKRRSLRARS